MMVGPRHFVASRTARFVGLTLLIGALLGGVAIVVQYRAALQIERTHLSELLESQAALIEAVRRFDAANNVSYAEEGALAATLSQVAEAQRAFEGFGASGVLVLGERRGDSILFHAVSRAQQGEVPRALPMGTSAAAPMQAALEGKTGTMEGPDFRGIQVLAAYRPLSDDFQRVGVVAKIDMEEIRGAVARAGVRTALALLVLTATLGLLFHFLGAPLLERMEKTEAALSESERRFRATFEQAGVGIALVSPEGRFLRVNDRYGEIIGYTPDEAEGLDFREITHPGDLEQDLESGRRLRTGEAESYSAEKRYLKRDGTQVWAHVTVALVKSDRGDPAYFISVANDISGRKRAESELRLYRRALELKGKIHESFLTVQDDSLFQEILEHILEATGSPSGAFGYLNSEGSLVIPAMVPPRRDGTGIPGSPVILPPTAWEEEPWSGAIRDREPSRSSASDPQSGPGGPTVSPHMTAPILEKGRAVGFLHVAGRERDYEEEDLSELVTAARTIAPPLVIRFQRDRAEAEARTAADLLERSNKDLQQFAYVASHDLQEPLRMVASYTQLLADRYRGKLDSDADDFIAFAVDGANRMRDLIQALLQYSRVGTQGVLPEEVDSDRVLRNTLRDLAPSIEDHQARVVVEDPLPVLWADPAQLGRVFLNLIGNALKFAPGKSGEIRIGAARENGGWTFRVQDNGPGIEPEYFERIFLIFQRLNPREEYPGAGMGLAISKRIIELHGGKIWVESTPGHGTTFRFNIPERSVSA